MDRMLTQLRRSGYLDGVAGIIGGTFTGCGAPALIEEILAERLGDLGVPLLAWANIGHGGHQQAYPIGIAAELDAECQHAAAARPAAGPARLAVRRPVPQRRHRRVDRHLTGVSTVEQG